MESNRSSLVWISVVVLIIVFCIIKPSSAEDTDKTPVKKPELMTEVSNYTEHCKSQKKGIKSRFLNRKSDFLLIEIMSTSTPLYKTYGYVHEDEKLYFVEGDKVTDVNDNQLKSVVLNLASSLIINFEELGTESYDANISECYFITMRKQGVEKNGLFIGDILGAVKVDKKGELSAKEYLNNILYHVFTELDLLTTIDSEHSAW
jgi:hypothetical protein